MRRKIDQALLQNPDSVHDFIYDLRQSGVEIIIHRDQDQGYSLTYIDYQNKIAIRDTDLGRAYGADKILPMIPRRPGSSLSANQQQTPDREQSPIRSKSPARVHDKERNISPDLSGPSGFNASVPQFLFALMRPESGFGTSPHELDQDQEIKRRRKH